MTGRTVQPDGKKVAQLRREKGLTQQHLADQVGASRRTIQNIEKGVGCLPTILKDVADTLGVDFKTLFISTSQPRIWSVPYPANPYFTGRMRILRDIHQAWEAQRPIALTQSLHGLGGVGKTQVALQYAYVYAEDYNAIIWIKADRVANIISDYVDLAFDLGLVENTDAESEAIAAIKTWLQGKDRWLLIFDNAEEPNDVLPYFPKTPTGHILITARNMVGWQEIANRYIVEVFERQESIDFLSQRTQQANPAAANELAELLGDLPLGLSQASAYIVSLGITIERYTETLRAQRGQLWQAEQPPYHYDATVETTWSLAMEELHSESPNSTFLLNLCAFFSPNDIALATLFEGLEALPEPLSSLLADSHHLQRTLAAMRRYALIDMHQHDTFSMHRLVQTVTRDRLSDEERQHLVDLTVQLFTRRFTRLGQGVHAWDISRRLLPHALEALDHAAALSAGRIHAVEELALHVKIVPKVIGLYGYSSAVVQKIYQRAQQICRALDVPPHLEFRVAYWGAVYFHLHANHEENQTLCHQLLNLADQANDNGLRLEAFMLYGMTHWALGELQSARTHLERGSQLYQSQRHRDHTDDFAQDPAIAISCYLSHVLWLSGYPEQALRKSEEARALAASVQYTENQAFAYHNAGVLYCYRREPRLAKHYADIAFSYAHEAELAHWELSSLIVKSWSLYMMNRQQGDLEQFRQAVRKWQQAMQNKLVVPFLLSNLAEFEVIAGNQDLGIALLDESIDVIKQTRECWWEAEIYRLKGEFYLKRDRPRLSEAKSYFAHALEISRLQQAKMLELRAAMSMSRLLHAQHQTREAFELLEPIYEWFTEGFDTVELQEAHALLLNLGRDQ